MLSVGWPNGIAPSENNIEVSYKVTLTLITGPSNLTPKYLPKGSEGIISQNDFCIYVQSSIIHGRIAKMLRKVKETKPMAKYCMIVSCESVGKAELQ